MSLCCRAFLCFPNSLLDIHTPTRSYIHTTIFGRERALKFYKFHCIQKTLNSLYCFPSRLTLQSTNHDSRSTVYFLCQQKLTQKPLKTKSKQFCKFAKEKDSKGRNKNCEETYSMKKKTKRKQKSVFNFQLKESLKNFR